jgi:hypothetical protein
MLPDSFLKDKKYLSKLLTANEFNESINNKTPWLCLNCAVIFTGTAYCISEEKIKPEANTGQINIWPYIILYAG